ncbi:dsDNA nuclease domain-containing protein [Desulforamulus aeronauticus]|uniref:CD-NTase associated protein 4-like DNA endonuclease domain-containing protein n=1 Tax=Desulforamulus aeronauticus DSM 10349 TaxID=1121421 RepID=A0A1M6Q4P4_9FIRM|nr:dsDNA nuclease domain-containing protein [Desulforamulus aeronauticus]SHK15244.1 protein of unknown function [Desulforamulus aeronauticus DSM 10349]
MGVISVYNSIPYDLSGAASKNRFRLEMLWGISKMFDLYDKPDFCVVFDYKCDIEIHFDDTLEFYQIKTHKVQSPYKFTVISKPDKNTGKSIIGRLYLLKNISDQQVSMKVALVSNAFFQIDKKVYSDVEVLKFCDLDEATQKKICDALKTELQQDDIDISNVHYIYTSMNLLDPENDIKGKIAGCFEKIKNCEPIKPNALYRLIRDTVDAKACYELKSDDYDELILHKGITKAQLDMMLNQYVDNTDNGVKQAQEYIESKYSVKERRKLKTALVHILEASVRSNELKNKEREISSYIDSNIENLPEEFEEIIDVLLQNFGDSFSVEYSREQIYVFLILILKRWEDGRNA